MPSAQSILQSLELAANEAVMVALAWHGVVLVAVLAIAFGWRPSKRSAGWLLAAPIASAAAAAFTYHNVFNSIVLGGLTVALAVIASRLGSSMVRRSNPTTTLAAVAMIAFGLVYPHFLEAPMYLWAAPTGVLPCPTLSLVIGFTLLGGGFGSRAWSRILAVAGLFYGAFGVALLGVRADVGLVAGSTVLGFVTFTHVPKEQMA